MSQIVVKSTLTAISPGLKSYFYGTGGIPPYTFSVRAGGAGGTINSVSGLYTAPSKMGTTPETLYDTIALQDQVGQIGVGQILVGSPLFLFCDIIQTYMGLSPGRVYLWDQKIFQPTDSGLYVAVSAPIVRPFANTTQYNGSAGLVAQQSVNVMATLEIDAISRDSEARDRKEEIVLALYSDYSIKQQEANSFTIGRLPPSGGFKNLSMVDGAAIPYRYKISVNVQYSFVKSVDVDYFDNLGTLPIYTNP